MDLFSTNLILESLETTWQLFVGFLPRFLIALIVFIFGWIVGIAFGTIVEHLFRMFKINELFAKLEIERIFERAGWRIQASVLLGTIVKWFFMIVFLLASVNILGLQEVSNFLVRILNYVPNVFVAALILIIGAIAADVLDRFIRGAAEAAGYGDASLIGTMTRWSIWVFTIFAALLQLGIAADLIRVFISGFVAMLALAGGLAFGLGGKEFAADVLKGMKSRLKQR